MNESDLLAAIDAFMVTVVEPLEQQHASVLSDPRSRFAPSGCYSDEILDLKRQIRTAAARAGHYAMFAPVQLGGGGGGPLLAYHVWEHLYHTAGPDRILPYDVIAHMSGGPSVALADISDSVRRDLWPGLMSGESVMCTALSEEPLRDPRSMATTATRDGDEWVIEGEKNWVSRGPYADVALVWAATRHEDEAGVTAFVMPTSTPGFSVRTITTLWGRGGGEEATITLDRVRVSDEHLVGRVNRGLDVLARMGPLSSMFTAGRFVGLARWALEATARECAKGAGTPPSVELDLGDSIAEIHAAHLLALDCARRLEAGDSCRQEMAMIWSFVPEVARSAFERCMRARGGVGLTSEARLFDGLHQSLIVLLADGGSRKRSLWSAALAGSVIPGRGGSTP